MRHRLAPLVLLATLSAPLHADELLMDVIQQDASKVPVKAGVTMDTVRQRLGEPVRTVPAVGDPPITRWVYDDYTVYFEYNRVIHAVPHHPQKPVAP